MGHGLAVSVSLLVWSCVLLSRPHAGWAGGKGKCEVCKNFVKAFEEGLKSTENSNFAGGDTSWEEEKLGSYANSEVRFVEILEGVCRDYECHSLLEENEEHVERWWFKLRHKKPDLKLWFCHDQLDVCCPENTFGPTCTGCPGGVENPCGGQGTCEGVEEKDGSGTCRCNRGYTGDACLECDSGFYNDSTSCVACHRSCKDRCSGGSASDCEECASGYVRSEDDTECKDVNECEERSEDDEPLCEEGKYCMNIPGSHRCNDCDKSCEKPCQGAGPARCVSCAVGYYMTRFNVCKDINECEGGEGWEGDPVTCEEATFCENTPGSYRCKACHVACLGGCRGAGPTNCVACKDGFNMDDGECKDVNECEDESPCDSETETCSNLIGSFKCKCKQGFVRVEGRCAEKVVKENKPKKKKKKKGNKAAGKRREDTVTAEQREREMEEERVREEERRVVEEEGERERIKRLGDLERGVEDSAGVEGSDTIPESHGPSQKSHDPYLKSHDQFTESHDPSQKSHDQSQKSHDQFTESHDQLKASPNPSVHQSGQTVHRDDLQDNSENHDEL